MSDDIVYEHHKYSELTPMMDEKQFARFKKNMEENGYDKDKPVWLFMGKILDGRNRDRSARELGIVCHYREFKGTDAEALAFSEKENQFRMHMDKTQAAIAAAETATMSKGRPKTNAPIGALKENPTQTQAAEDAGVSRRTVQRVKQVMDEGTPEVIEALKKGDITPYAASKTLKKPKDDLPDNVTPIGVECKEKPTKKQAEVRRTKEYRALESEHSKLKVRVGFLEEENRKLKEENKMLKQSAAL